MSCSHVLYSVHYRSGFLEDDESARKKFIESDIDQILKHNTRVLGARKDDAVWLLKSLIIVAYPPL